MTAMQVALRMRTHRWRAYGAGVAFALVALLLRLLLLPHLHGYPFVTFLPAVVVVAFFAGMGPGMVCAGLSAIFAARVFAQVDAPATFGANLPVAIILFGLISALIAFLIDFSVNAYSRLEVLQAERRAELERQIESRTVERDRLWSLSQDPFLITDRQGVWLAASPAWERILGWPLENLIGHDSGGILHPEDRDRTRCERDFVFSGGVSVRFQTRYRALDGSYRWFSWNAVAEDDRLYCVARDVTAVRASAREMEQTQEALIQTQKIEAMGKVTGGVAHDFNNLLTPILGGLDMLKRNGMPDSRIERLVDGALQAAERARILVQRLLAFARRQPLHIAPIDFTALVESLRELLGSTLGPRIGLTIDLPPALLVRADAAQLEMALLNLAVNAHDAMPEGGEMTLSASPIRLAGKGTGLAAGDYARITVADTGVGMDAKVLEQAIEPFYSTKGIGRGTGLGLSMVHGLMGQLGGAMNIESTPGKGTRIHLWLPIADALPDTRATAGAPADLQHTGSALLVDDEDLVRASVAAMLANLGYDVIQAGNGDEALKLVNQHGRFDLIVADHLMPGMTGTELAAEVKRMEPGQRVIIISGYSDLDQIAPGLPRLCKPFRQDELAGVIEA